MVGLDAAGKTTVLYYYKLGEFFHGYSLVEPLF